MKKLKDLLGVKYARNEHKGFVFMVSIISIMLAVFSGVTEYIAITDFSGLWIVGLLSALVIEIQCLACFKAVGAILRAQDYRNFKTRNELIFIVVCGIIAIGFSLSWSYQGILLAKNARTDFENVSGVSDKMAIRNKYNAIEAEIRAKYNVSEQRTAIQSQLADLQNKLSVEQKWSSQQALIRSIKALEAQLNSLSPTAANSAMQKEITDTRNQLASELAMLEQADKEAKDANESKLKSNEQNSYLLNVMLAIFMIISNAGAGYFGAADISTMPKPSKDDIRKAILDIYQKHQRNGKNPTQESIAREANEQLGGSYATQRSVSNYIRNL